MKKALISVSNKDNVIYLAQELVSLGYEIISTGGTYEQLKHAQIDVKQVESLTDFPEILDGRVKTLHPHVHGGLLAKRGDETHEKQLAENQIEPIDLVVVNLYPFKETLKNESATHEDMIENIDIGGPTMLRAAAKNYSAITVVVDPDDYSEVIEQLKADTLDASYRQKLAAKVFQHTAQYDSLIAQYFSKLTGDEYPEHLTITYEKVQTLRYGENPHQQASFYKHPLAAETSLVNAEQLHGKELSFNNIQDANAAVEVVTEYEEPTTVAIKHMNPCGIGTGDTIEQSFQKAYEADSISIFGGIVACNREVNLATAEAMSEIFLEIIIAPSFTDEAFSLLTKKKNIRLLRLRRVSNEELQGIQKYVSISGGLLVQEEDAVNLDEESLTYPTNRQPTEAEMRDLLFAWKAVKHVKSNAIALAKDNQTIGIGAGQMNRIGAAEIAIKQAAEKAKGSVLASDAFIPMADTAETAVKAGISAIIQPGGSARDQEVIDICNEHNIAMVYTGMRHFKH
ncbi:MAG TPA: bifunctional phosphoribosylaminoimidazolecarboxamide formyltransferase/IMP cyclohydrolase [Bacillota bacterium]|nr:bifunctional phosphoribosylaminoimidazolecarboxamide formyltransferase/IMP cyclohydrolase [Bacillota bacterium]